MLGGLRFEKQEKAEEPKDKKSKKKERRKEQKKNKKRKDKKNKKDDKVAVSSSGSSDDDGEAAVAASAPAAAIPPPSASLAGTISPIRHASKGAPVQDVKAEPSSSAKAAPSDNDLFSNMGTAHKKEISKKPNPDILQVYKMELNPILTGKEATQAAPVSVGSIPKHLTVGDGGNTWRNRAKRRAAQMEAAETNAAAPAILTKLGSEGPATTAGKQASRRDRSKSHSKSRVRNRSRSRQRSGARGRSRSRSRNAKKDRRSPTPQKGRPRSPTPVRKHSGRKEGSRREGSRSSSDERHEKDKTTALRGRGSNAASDWCKRDEKILQERNKKADEDMDDVLNKLQSKYSNADAATGNEQPPAQQAAAADEDGPEDGNELAALAMQAMLSGDMDRYEALNKRLEKKQAETAKPQGNSASKPSLPPPPSRSIIGERVEVLEEIDASGRSRALLESVQSASLGTGKKGAKKLRGEANVGPGEANSRDAGPKGKKETGFYCDDEISLQDLIRKEKIEGVQDYDANFADHIVNSKKFKAIHADDDEAYGLAMYEGKDKKADAKRLAAKQQRQQVSEKSRLKHNLEHCHKCMESKRCRVKDSIISSSANAYVCMDDFKSCILPGQVLICPQEHASAVTDLEDSVNTDIRNYQKCLVRFFEAQDPPRAVIFAESSIHRATKERLLLGAGSHAVIVAYPVELEIFSQARSFFKKAFDEAEDEWVTQHKKVIETTAKGGIRAAVPKHFPYVHIDFSLGGGYAHVIEDASEFAEKFVHDTIAGMCELTILDRAYPTQTGYWEAFKGMRQTFQKGYDWTQSLH